eukprot:TRINITY_DN25041_c0_g2_i1.p1 TRINITY_DN25041_c0_g2~~TRINITY_DN25041_c0_g2_i1.p1  ORF type:complete len:206 (-),score=-30.33 TRINITY_DN25041_c0_g2_i1:226-843(-)
MYTAQIITESQFNLLIVVLPLLYFTQAQPLDQRTYILSIILQLQQFFQTYTQLAIITKVVQTQVPISQNYFRKQYVSAIRTQTQHAIIAKHIYPRTYILLPLQKKNKYALYINSNAISNHSKACLDSRTIILLLFQKNSMQALYMNSNAISNYSNYSKDWPQKIVAKIQQQRINNCNTYPNLFTYLYQGFIQPLEFQAIKSDFSF